MRFIGRFEDAQLLERGVRAEREFIAARWFHHQSALRSVTVAISHAEEPKRLLTRIQPATATRGHELQALRVGVERELELIAARFMNREHRTSRAWSAKRGPGRALHAEPASVCGQHLVLQSLRSGNQPVHPRTI